MNPSENNKGLQTTNGTAVATTSPPSIKGLLGSEGIKKRFEEILGEKAPGFISSILNVVNGSTNLSMADPQSVIMSAAVAATLDLPINPNLGFAYIIPYKTTYTDDNGQTQVKYVAQFQMGYKGFIQLAMRTGQYKKINATEVRAGQLIKSNPLTEEYEFDFSKEGGEVIGYVAYFQLLNGFEKTIYWNVAKVMAHAQKYSKSFGDKSGPWKTNTPEMAFKTLLKNMLSKYGILSIEMQKASKFDQAVINDERTEDISYVDSTQAHETSTKAIEGENKTSEQNTNPAPVINLPNSSDL